MAEAAPHKGQRCSQKGRVGWALTRELSVPATKTTTGAPVTFSCWLLVAGLLLLEYINVVISELSRTFHSPIEATGP